MKENSKSLKKKSQECLNNLPKLIKTHINNQMNQIDINPFKNNKNYN